MLEIDMEFRKGILFIRLLGELTAKTVFVLNREVTKVIEEYRISNLVFNVDGLSKIDDMGIHALYDNYKIARDNHGTVLVCGLHNDETREKFRGSNLLNFMYETSDELSAIDKVKL